VQFWRGSAEAAFQRAQGTAEGTAVAGGESETAARPINREALLSGDAPAHAQDEDAGTTHSPVQPLLWDELTSDAAAAVMDSGALPKDDLFDKAVEVVKTHQRASITLLQRRLRVGYARAARLMDLLEAEGIVGPDENNKGRQVLVDSNGEADGDRSQPPDPPLSSS
jgi:DNA segregation ATPase FtsK/SpoIIIE-like protein